MQQLVWLNAAACLAKRVFILNENIAMEEIWKKILRHSGETFYTKTGKPFTYSLGTDDNIYIDTVISRPLTYKLFQKALPQGNKPRLADYKVYNICNIYSILSDKRIGAWA
ncbi:hypothetical protein [uncultured Arcticibacterium sp.]|uniref:hypothetical protein n=1 Tax=uncultured Arcticibacterium sp. TaxID=2173042 RepID=UPI0030F7462F